MQIRLPVFRENRKCQPVFKINAFGGKPEGHFRSASIIFVSPGGSGLKVAAPGAGGDRFLVSAKES